MDNRGRCEAARLGPRFGDSGAREYLEEIQREDSAEEGPHLGCSGSGCCGGGARLTCRVVRCA
jgi:hypothetical protein